MDDRERARGVHLVGAINLDSVEDVFTKVPEALGTRIKRIPDGEPGPRRLFVSYQYPLLRAQTFVETVPGAPVFFFPILRLREGVEPAEVRFGELGYAREARASYEQFRRARDDGRIPASCRFQVSLPTPFEVLYSFVEPASLAVLERAYEKAMLAELAAICHAIPHADLSIQWDLCTEMVLWDGRLMERLPEVWYRPFDDVRGELLERVSRLSDAVPRDVELGYHLCYGDLDHKHFIDPEDTAAMAAFASALCERVERPVSWIHLPALASWTTPAPFESLRGLAALADTELYLGLVHHHDGVEGARRRIAAAHEVLADFGVATECGMGRRAAGQIGELMRTHAAIADPR